MRRTVNRNPTAATTNGTNFTNGAYPYLAASRLGVNRLFGSGFEPQRTQSFTEMNRKPTAQTTNLPRGRRGHANGFPVGPGVDRAGTDLCGLRGSVRDGLFGSGSFVAAPGGRGVFDPARSTSAPTAGRRKHQIIGLTPFPIATSTRWPTGSESVGPGVDRAGFEPQRTQRFTEESMALAKAQRAQRPGSNPLAASRLGVRRLFGSGFAVGPGVDRAVPVAAPGGRGVFDPARSTSAPTAGRRKHQIIGLTPFPIATSTRWPTGSESVGPGVDRAGFEPQRTQRFAKESISLAKLAKPKAWSAKGAKFTSPCALRGSVRDGLFGSGFFVAAPGGRGVSDPARSTSAPTAGRRKHQIIGLTPFRTMNDEIIFDVRVDEVDGGYAASALGVGIHTQGETPEEVRANVREAVACYYDEGEKAPSGK